MKRCRSLLFVPADDAKRLAKCHERGADAIILDLEDAVAAGKKPGARGQLRHHIAKLADRDVQIVLRVNTAWQDIVADLDAGIDAALAAVMVPKVEDAARLGVISQMIEEWEVMRNILPGTVGIIALVETAKGLSALDKITRVSRVTGIALGTEDFSLSLGVAPSPAALDLPCRQVALAASTRSLMALAMPISIADFRDEHAMRTAARAARTFGTTGALCIHPAQVAIANETFAPGGEDLRDAQAIIDAWAQALVSGAGVANLNGRMIDKPVVERAKRVLGVKAVEE